MTTDGGSDFHIKKIFLQLDGTRRQGMFPNSRLLLQKILRNLQQTHFSNTNRLVLDARLKQIDHFDGTQLAGTRRQ